MEEDGDAQNSMVDSGEEDDLSSYASNSTAVYDHEAFETFRNQVLALASVLRVQFLDVERPESGWLHRTAALTMQDPPSEAGLLATTKTVLWIPQLLGLESSWDDVHESQGGEAVSTKATENPYTWFHNRPAYSENARLKLLDEAAVLNLLASSNIQVSKVIALDITPNNPLGSPYSLHTRLPGVNLGEVWKTMSIDDKMNIAEELAGILAGLDAIRFPEAGRLLHDDSLVITQMPLDLVKRNEIGKNVVVGGFYRGAGIFDARDRPSAPTTSTLYDLLSTHIDDQIQYREFISPDYLDKEIPNLKAMLQEMKDMNWFTSDDGSADYSVMNHGYLFSEDLMVEQTRHADGSSGWHITGVVRWDDAHCVPPVLARQPPTWLWDYSDHDLLPSVVRKYYDADFDMMPLEYYEEINSDHLTAEGAKIKERFEQVMVDKIYASRYGARAMEVYRDDAYGRGRWLRRVWRFAKEGISSIGDTRRFRQVSKEWVEFKQTGRVSHSTVFDSDDDSLLDFSSSTFVNDHEPFETFQHKISTLGADLGVEFDDIEHMKGGSFNRVVPVTLRNLPETTSWADGTQAIIRIPRVWDGDLAKIPANLHGRTCKCDAHPERKEVDGEGDTEISNSNSTASKANNTGPDFPSAESSSAPKEPGSIISDPVSEMSRTAKEDEACDDSVVSDISDTSDVSDISSRRSLSKEPYRWEILDETVLYNLLEDSGIPAPRILAFDISRENALRLPYSVQTRLPGVTWQSIIEKMPLESQLQLAEELARIMALLQKVQFESSGRLLCHQQLDTPLQLSFASSSRVEIKEELKIWGFPKGIGPLMDSERISPCQPVDNSLYDLLFYTTQELIDQELQKVGDDGPSQELVRMYFKLQDIIQDMDRLGWFSEADKAPSKSVLHHWDLEARNILVEQIDSNPSSPWRITGVIDWDHPHALPPVLTMKPPIWLFDASDDSELPGEVQEYYDNDFDWLPLEYYQKENAQHLNADGVKVKRRFEEEIVKRLYKEQYGADAHAKYLDDAYGRGRWLRRIWRFASEGLSERPTHWRRMEQLDREWTKYKRVNRVKYDHFKHAEALRVYSSMVWPNRAREGGQSEFKGILHDVAAKSDQETAIHQVIKSQATSDPASNANAEDKLDTVALTQTGESSSEDSATEPPEQTLPRSKTFSSLLQSFKCPVS